MTSSLIFTEHTDTRIKELEARVSERVKELNLIALYFTASRKEIGSFAKLLLKTLDLMKEFIESFMYRMNRLIRLYLPSLHFLHFKLHENNINAVYYASGWFITYFCYALQYIKSTQAPSFLIVFFDKYLLVLL